MMAALQQPLFQPNNHSKYLIDYSEVGGEVKELIASLAKEHYGIDASSVHQVKELEMNSNNFKIISADGKKFFIRKNISNNDKAKVLWEHKLLGFCLGKEIKVSEPVSTSKSEAFAEKAGSFFTAYKFLEGTHYAGSFEELGSAAEEIAKLHSALKDLPFKDEVSKKFNMLTNSYSLELLRQLNGLNKGQNEVDKNMSDNLELIEKSTKEVLSNLIKLNNNIQIIHGDLHPHNFIFSGHEIKSILDFGEMREGPLVEDVAYACYRLTRQLIVNLKISEESEMKNAISRAKNIFFENYNKNNNLSKEEFALIPMMIKHIALKKVFFILSKHYLENQTKWDFDLMKHINSLKEAEYFA